jgi:GntR family transcriptional repressor for pyruvate dehydrogenase complex
MIDNKIPQGGISEYVLNQLIETIQSGKYKVGNKLPTEAEICEIMGVSRPSVREALSALRLAGFIETKKGDGTYIKALSVNLGQDKETFDHGTNIFELLEARRIIEPAVGQLALEVMSEKFEEKIRLALDGMHKAAKEKDFITFHSANKAFHLALVEATHNSSLINYTRSLLDLFSESDFGVELRRCYLTETKYIDEALQVHEDIYESIKARDKDKLEQAFIRHNDQVEKQLLGRSKR